MSTLNDQNGKKCGIIKECLDAGVIQQRTRWNQEAARALQTKEAARTYAKKSMMPDDEINRARVLRLKMTKENRMRARVQVAALSMKYRAVKNAMLTGSLDKSAFEKAYKLTARQIAQYRAQFASRQRDIEESWNLVVQRQRSAEAYIAADLQKIEEIFEQSLASIADRYGKRIAYFQSLPIVENLTMKYISLDTSVTGAVNHADFFQNQWTGSTAGTNAYKSWESLGQIVPTNQAVTATCPIYEDGLASY